MGYFPVYFQGYRILVTPIYKPHTYTKYDQNILVQEKRAFFLTANGRTDGRSYIWILGGYLQ